MPLRLAWVDREAEGASRGQSSLLAEQVLAAGAEPSCAAWAHPFWVPTAACLANKHVAPCLAADVERIADPASSLPHMLPSEREFAAAADALGIANDDALVVYDNTGGCGASTAHGQYTCQNGAAASASWCAAALAPCRLPAQTSGHASLFSGRCMQLQASSPARAPGGPGTCLGTASEAGCVEAGCAWHDRVPVGCKLPLPICRGAVGCRALPSLAATTDWLHACRLLTGQFSTTPAGWLC